MRIENESKNKSENDGAAQTASSFLISPHVPTWVSELLSIRGIKTIEEQTRFLVASLKSMKSPFVLKGMKQAVERIFQAYQKNQTLLIYGDYDLDGTSAVAILKTGFSQLGFSNLKTFQPHRFDHGYGIHSWALKKFKDEGVDLVITVDLGITNVEEVQFGNEIGLDIIVTDHHQPREVLPPAIAVINPNQKECDAELGHLCGTGVAFYLVLAMKMKFEEMGLSTTNLIPKDLLDYFALGTIADMVPLKEENRILVKHGLTVLGSTQRHGLKELLIELGVYGGAVKSLDVAMKVAPKLNALSRMAHELSILEIYLETEKDKAFEKVQTAMATNKVRQSRQKEAEERAIELALPFESHGFIFVCDKAFHPGIVGLVATQLTQKFGKPAFVAGFKENGSYVGSARIPNDLNWSLLEALDASAASLVKYGGHKAAAGFELEESQIENFKTALELYFSTANLEVQSAKPWNFDVKISLEDLNFDALKWLQKLEPFGIGFEAPKFLLQGLRVQSVQILKEKYLKLKLAQSGRMIDALWFSVPGRVLKEELPEIGEYLDIIGQPQLSEFRGQTTLQFLVENIARSQLLKN